MLKFNIAYLFIAVILFLVEVLIALYAHDNFIRPWLGDFLVVILIYCFVKAFLNLPVLPAAIGVLLFSFLVEFAQYFNIVNRLGLQHSKLAKIILGSSFEWTDLLAYTLGILLVFITERRIHPGDILRL